MRLWAAVSSRPASRMRRFIARALALAADVRGRPIDPGARAGHRRFGAYRHQGRHAQGFDTLFITSGIHRAELHAEAGAGPLNAAALHQFLDHLGFARRRAAAELLW